MKKSEWLTLVIVIVLGAGVAGYFYWRHTQATPEQALVNSTPPPALPTPAAATPPPARQVVEPAASPASLPPLADSDKFTLDALAALIGDKSLMKFFHTDRVVHHIVATIDNLPRQRVSMSVLPLVPVSGSFETVGSGDDLMIGTSNNARYAPYVTIAESVNAKKLVGLYIRLYPLFQRSYEELGYPKQYFNDRVIQAIDDLEAAPDVTEPVKLVQPHVFYLYADPDLEGRSIGQKTLMRMGSQNEAKIKAKLKEIKEELALHMHEVKVDEPQ